MDLQTDADADSPVTVLQPYCNRYGTSRYAMDKPSTANPEKPCKTGEFPDALVRTRIVCLGLLIRRSQVRVLPGARFYDPIYKDPINCNPFMHLSLYNASLYRFVRGCLCNVAAKDAMTGRCSIHSSSANKCTEEVSEPSDLVAD